MSIADKIKSLIFGVSAESGAGAVLSQNEQTQTSKTGRNEDVSNLLEERARLVQEISDALRLIVSKHGKTLDIKMQQMSYQDAYGNYIFDKFFDERDYFIKNVMCRDVPSTIIDFLFSPESYSADTIRLFNEGFNNYLRVKEPQLAQTNIDEIDPVGYELHCVELLESVGWNARTTKASGDQGIDIIATLETIKVVGQCKLYSNPVGNAAVQEIIAGREFEKADFAFVVSNSSFTPAARALASSSNVLLIHHSELIDLHNKLNISMPANGKPSVTIDKVSDHPIERVSRPLNEIIEDTYCLIGKFEAIRFSPNSEESEILNDPLFAHAVEIVLRNRRASISLVQRQLSIGYNRAARLIEQMEAAGLVSPMQSNGNREVLAPSRAG